MIKFPSTTRVKANDAESAEAFLEMVPIDKIRPNPYQPRKHFAPEAISDLSASIRQVGLLQPITVRRMGSLYELIAGERRLRACKMAGFTHIRAMVTTVQDKDSAMIALVENLQRENLHFFEEAEGFLNLIKEHGFTQEELAKRLSKNQSTIANKLRILRLPKKIKTKIKVHNLTERHARALLRLHNEEAQEKLLEKVVQGDLSVKTTESLVETELQNLYGEAEKGEKKTFRIKCSHTVYLNTIKKCLQTIRTYGADTNFEYTEFEDHLQVNIIISK